MRTILVAAALALSACASGPTDEAVMLASSKGREPGSIRIGDTVGYVESQWGQPCETYTSIYEGFNAIYWDYCIREWTGEERSTYATVVFVNGEVAALHDF